MNPGNNVWKYTQNERKKKKEESNIEDDLFTTFNS